MGTYRVRGIIRTDNLDILLSIDMLVNAVSMVLARCHVLLALNDKGYRYPRFVIDPVVSLCVCKCKMEEVI